MSEYQEREATSSGWQTKALIIGTALGALLGAMTAYLLIRTAEENTGEPPRISTKDAIKSAVGIIGLMRGIASLGD